MTDAHHSWILTDPEGRLRIVTPEDRARSAEQAISEGWREVAERGGLEGVVDWVLEVGKQHGYPLDEEWVRSTFDDLVPEV